MVTIGLASLSSGELMQTIRRNGLSSGISRNGVVAARVPRLLLRQPAGSDALTPLVETNERPEDGLIPQGGTHDGPLPQWSAWFVAPRALGSGAAEGFGSSGGGADRASTGAADGDG